MCLFWTLRMDETVRRTALRDRPLLTLRDALGGQPCCGVRQGFVPFDGQCMLFLYSVVWFLFVGPCEMPACTTDESYSVFNPRSRAAPSAGPGPARVGQEEAKPHWEDGGPGLHPTACHQAMLGPTCPSALQPWPSQRLAAREAARVSSRRGEHGGPSPGAGAPAFPGGQENVRPDR